MLVWYHILIDKKITSGTQMQNQRTNSPFVKKLIASSTS